MRSQLLPPGSGNSGRSAAHREDSMRTTRQEMLRLRSRCTAVVPVSLARQPGERALPQRSRGKCWLASAPSRACDSLVQQGEKDVAMLERYVARIAFFHSLDSRISDGIPTPLFMRGVYGVAGAVFARPRAEALDFLLGHGRSHANGLPSARNRRCASTTTTSSCRSDIHEAVLDMQCRVSMRSRHEPSGADCSERSTETILTSKVGCLAST